MVDVLELKKGPASISCTLLTYGESLKTNQANPYVETENWQSENQECHDCTNEILSPHLHHSILGEKKGEIENTLDVRPSCVDLYSSVLRIAFHKIGKCVFPSTEVVTWGVTPRVTRVTHQVGQIFVIRLVYENHLIKD
jgi:hypothetical protein